MAKPKKEEQSRSVLKLAYQAFERGDVVKTRELAKAVLAGKVAPDDEQVARELSKTLSIAEAVVGETPAAVAQELISRTITPPRPYLFVAAAAGTFITLAVLAHLRY